MNTKHNSNKIIIYSTPQNKDDECFFPAIHIALANRHLAVYRRHYSGGPIDLFSLLKLELIRISLKNCLNSRITLEAF